MTSISRVNAFTHYEAAAVTGSESHKDSIDPNKKDAVQTPERSHIEDEGAGAARLAKVNHVQVLNAMKSSVGIQSNEAEGELDEVMNTSPTLAKGL